MLYGNVPSKITKENLKEGISKALLGYYVYLEDPINFVIKKIPEVIQVYSTSRKDRVSKTTFRSKTIVNTFDDVNQPGPSGLPSRGRGIKEVDEADWVDKLFNVKKKKIVRPSVKLDDQTTRQPSTISKKKLLSTGKRRSTIARSRSKMSSRKSSRAWAEASHEQFLNLLTTPLRESKVYLKKNYLSKVVGKHDTEVMGLDLPIFVPNSSNEMLNQKYGAPKQKIIIQEPVNKSKQSNLKTTIKVLDKKKIEIR